VPTSKPQPDGTLIKALARAWRWQRMLDEGVFTSVSEIGDSENISKSYVSRILRLALLSPDIIEAILAGRTDQGMMLERLERPLPAIWEEQWRRLVAGTGAVDPIVLRRRLRFKAGRRQCESQYRARAGL
jgi:hypothetical protein